jgi:hypothetical protein
MSRWVLLCPSCHQEFTHSQIKRETLEDYFLGEIKPQFPESGLSISCPNCHTTSVYQRFQLRYRSEDVPVAAER